MEKHYSFKVDLNKIEYTDELLREFEITGSKVIKTVSPLSELRGILPDKVIESYPTEQKVLIVADYGHGRMDVDIL